jgi:GNAT superfamily N-acetyltransferase
MNELLLAAAANCASAYAAWAEAMGHPVERADDVWMADLELPVAAPPNGATLLRPFEGAAASLAERTSRFFAAPGGGYQVWDLWGSVDLGPRGFGRGAAPCMVRDPGPPPAAPPELAIEPATDAASLLEAESVALPVFGIAGARPRSAFGEALVRSGALSVVLGRVEGRPVATAAAHVAAGFVGVYAVAVVPEARRRGYGEALTWAAMQTRPDLPATLQASGMGAPVYTRMGYRTIGTFTIWQRERAATERRS